MTDETNTERVTVWLSESLREDMDANYVDWRYESRSQWVREAVDARMTLEDALAAAGVELPPEGDARDRLIQRVVRAGVRSLGDELADVAEAAD